MKRERVKEIIKSHEEPKKPSADYILELSRMQYDFIGLDVDMNHYVKYFKTLRNMNKFEKEQYFSYKAKVFEMLMKDFGYSFLKCEMEFSYFMFHYGLPNWRDYEASA
jgi:hypothetical protein